MSYRSCSENILKFVGHPGATVAGLPAHASNYYAWDVLLSSFYGGGDVPHMNLQRLL